MNTTRNTGDDLYGAAVFTTDGARVGIVTEANVGYVVVRRRPSASDYFIPRSAILRAEGRRLVLSASRTDLLDSGWNRGQAMPPR